MLPRVLQQLGLDEGILGWRAVREWAEIVGPEVARHSRAMAFHEGVLQVEVEASPWMFELGFQKPVLLEKVNAHLGRRLVRDVRFRVPRGGILR